MYAVVKMCESHRCTLTWIVFESRHQGQVCDVLLLSIECANTLRQMKK